MVPGLGCIVEHRPFRFQQDLLQRFFFVGRAGNQFVQVVYVRLQMLAPAAWQLWLPG